MAETPSRTLLQRQSSSRVSFREYNDTYYIDVDSHGGKQRKAADRRSLSQSGQQSPKKSALRKPGSVKDAYLDCSGRRHESNKPRDQSISNAAAGSFLPNLSSTDATSTTTSRTSSKADSVHFPAPPPPSRRVGKRDDFPRTVLHGALLEESMTSLTAATSGDTAAQQQAPSSPNSKHTPASQLHDAGGAPPEGNHALPLTPASTGWRAMAMSVNSERPFSTVSDANGSALQFSLHSPLCL